MRVLICGSRGYNDEEEILNVLRDLKSRHDDLTIIEGTADGADRLAGRLARWLALEVIEFLPDWERYGNRAGVIRNSQMLKEGRPDLVIAFSNVVPVGAELKLTVGTQDMVLKALRGRVPVQIHLRPVAPAPKPPPQDKDPGAKFRPH